MRYCASLLLLLTVILGCSKDKKERTNFAELTIRGHKFVFDSREAVFDTSYQGQGVISCDFELRDRASNSYMTWETMSGTKWINGIYEYPGQYWPGRSIVLLHLQTYIDRVPGSYAVQNNAFTLTIDQSDNGRMHGTFTGKMLCYTCDPYGTEEKIVGEFEMPYRYQ